MDKLYIGIGSLLDLELGLVRQHKKPKQVLKFLRQSAKLDVKHPSVHLGLFTQEKFDKYWDESDKGMLANALRTRMDVYLREILESVATPVLTDPQDSKVEVHVDLFPFELDEKEQGWLMSALTVMLGYDAVIKFIDVGLGGVHSAFIENYKWVFINDVETWLRLSARSLKEKPQYATNVILPAYTTGIKFSDLVEDPDVDLTILAANSPHAFVSSIIGQIVKVDFIDHRYFRACLE